MNKCTECDCLEGKTSDIDTHYKGCSSLDLYANKYITKFNMREHLESHISSCLLGIEYYKQEIKEIRDCIKDVCLDEIYLCRWDCTHEQLEAA